MKDAAWGLHLNITHLPNTIYKMQTASFSSLLSSHVHSPGDVSAVRKSFLGGKTWALKDQCSLRGVANDLTAVSRRRKGEVVDLIALETCLLTLSSHGSCVLRSPTDLTHSLNLTPVHEQVQYILSDDDYLYMISVSGKNPFLGFSRTRLADLSLTCTYREEIMRECRVTTEEVLAVEKKTGDVVVRREDCVEVWGLRDMRLKRTISVPSSSTHLCYDSGTISFSEINDRDVILHILPSHSLPTRITLRSAESLLFLDILSDFVLFQVAGSPLQAVNFTSGLRIECPKNTQKLVACRGVEPFLIDETGVLMKLADWDRKVGLNSADVEMLWVDKLGAFFVYGADKTTVDVVSVEEGRVVSSIPSKRGDGVTFCAFNEETFEVVLVTQKGMLEIWH